MTDFQAKMLWVEMSKWTPCLLCRGAGRYTVKVRRYQRGTLMQVFFPDDSWENRQKSCPHCKGLGRLPVVREWKNS